MLIINRDSSFIWQSLAKHLKWSKVTLGKSLWFGTFAQYSICDNTRISHRAFYYFNSNLLIFSIKRDTVDGWIFLFISCSISSIDKVRSYVYFRLKKCLRFGIGVMPKNHELKLVGFDFFYLRILRLENYLIIILKKKRIFIILLITAWIVGGFDCLLCF